MSRYEEWKTARAWSSPKMWQEPLRLLSGGRFFIPNVRELVTAVDELFMEGANHNGFFLICVNPRSSAS